MRGRTGEVARLSCAQRADRQARGAPDAVRGDPRAACEPARRRFAAHGSAPSPRGMPGLPRLPRCGQAPARAAGRRASDRTGKWPRAERAGSRRRRRRRGGHRRSGGGRSGGGRSRCRAQRGRLDAAEQAGSRSVAGRRRRCGGNRLGRRPGRAPLAHARRPAPAGGRRRPRARVRADRAGRARSRSQTPGCRRTSSHRTRPRSALGPAKRQRPRSRRRRAAPSGHVTRALAGRRARPEARTPQTGEASGCAAACGSAARAHRAWPRAR